MKAHLPQPGAATVVPLRDVERELSRRLQLVQGPGEAPIQRACMSNLMIFCDTAELVEKVQADIPAVVALHPARVLLLHADASAAGAEVTASVRVRGRVVDPGRWVCSEEVTLHASGGAVERLPFAVRSLLIGDLPTNLWWASTQPPPLAGALLAELAECTNQVIYDSYGWLEPARGVAATAGWLEKVEQTSDRGRWRVASDLNWRRLKFWRRLLGQTLDPATAPGVLESITEVLVEHGPHAVIQAWELVSWLVSRLGWRVQAGRVQPGVEIVWQFQAAHGPIRARIRRLPQGPSEVRRVRLACTLDGKPGALDVVVEEERRLAVRPEGVAAAERTMTFSPLPQAELVGRQLSDRERDPVFRASMGVAQVLARSVLGA
jgi:glucose-6-phosphate dehydrogenase assembly protein OpcA